MLEPLKPTEYLFSVSPRELWQVTEEVVHMNIKGRILTKDENYFVMSWIETLDEEVDKRKRKKLKDLSFLQQLSIDESREVGAGGYAITTIYISPAHEGAQMRIRRVYYGRHTQPMMVHSRGGFAKYIRDSVQQELTKRGF